MRFVHLLIPAAACLVACRTSAAPLRPQARGPTVWKTAPLRVPQEFGTVSYCVGQDFDPSAGPCVQEQSVEPFGTCFSLAGGPFDKTVASFATSACTGFAIHSLSSLLVRTASFFRVIDLSR
ncbi:hypothetical protein K466DRAFT_589550 [Polyporus arcularius HHB13444]|uniref:Uncharacterized protein n=1 Tax=Polyporus arcularius HHB13444 TaxID=1314778 RepID=A0A5C3P5U7_9APHY|nr:hypothetical protein K466DRAFT_589550 [Polyporus arcularius HHB13444]